MVSAFPGLSAAKCYEHNVCGHEVHWKTPVMSTILVT